jgi:hypothetical protein
MLIADRWPGIPLELAKLLFQRLHPLRNRSHRVTLRIGERFEPADDTGLRISPGHRTRGHPHRSGIFWNITQYDRSATDSGMVTNGDIAKDLGANSDHYVVTQGWMPFTAHFACSAESDPLVERAVIADDGGFTYDDAHTVVDEEPPANGGARMDFDPCHQATDVTDDASKEAKAHPMKPRRHFVKLQGVESGIDQNDLECGLCGWIARFDRRYFLSDAHQLCCFLVLRRAKIHRVDECSGRRGAMVTRPRDRSTSVQ